MANVIADRCRATSADRIVIGGHYDTKLFREFRFVGANDGGSSAALLLELARALKGRTHPFTDRARLLRRRGGDPAGLERQRTTPTAAATTWQRAQADGRIKGLRAMILVDMIGDRDLQLRREARSTPWLTDIAVGLGQAPRLRRALPRSTRSRSRTTT